MSRAPNTIGSYFLLLLLCLAGPIGPARGQCHLPDSAAWLVSPESPAVGDMVTVLVAGEEHCAGCSSEVTGPSGPVTVAYSHKVQGPSPWLTARFAVAEAGEYRLFLDGPSRKTCIVVRVVEKRGRAGTPEGVWETRHNWSRRFEELYQAWLEHLFDVPEGTSWLELHQLTRQFERNLLHDHLKIDEDAAGRRGLRMDPDCADHPYYLRAYFSWKLGLPFGFHHCTRGRRGENPVCQQFTSNETQSASGRGPGRFHRFLRQLKSAVHASSARTALADNVTDLYPVPLSRDSLVPGTVFADAYGHTLMLVRWIPQGDSPGVLLAADAQPDGTVAVKRFWQGNFLFETEDVVGGAGFKAFRPVARRRGKLGVLDNRALEKSNEFIRFSLQQENLSRREFHDIMEGIINPAPLDPEAAYRLLHDALEEQMKTRVQSVQIFYDLGLRGPVSMPGGKAIFQTSGPWESYSTPSRDMRLLIAMDVIAEFPDRVRRMPAAFALPSGKTAEQVAVAMEALHKQWAGQRTVEYVRSDGKKQTLTMARLMGRAFALETAYNPNDCIEVRWGAREGSPEYSSCRKRAPRAQLRKMEKYRVWFKERRRP